MAFKKNSSKNQFHVLARNYQVRTPRQVKEKIIFKLLDSIVVRLWNIEGKNDTSHASKFLRKLRSQWKVVEQKERS